MQLIPAHDATIDDMATQTALRAIAGADLAAGTQTKYRRAIERYVTATGAPITDTPALREHASTLPVSGRAQLKAAVRLWAKRAIDDVKAVATPENYNAAGAAILRLEALQSAIKVQTRKGQSAHTWLTPAEVKRLLSLPDDSPKGQRDRLALGLLVAAGLRRAEAVALTFGDLITQPVKGRPRAVLQVAGKGDKARVVPVRDSLAAAIRDWAGLVGDRDPAGLVLRAIDKGGRVAGSLSAVGLFNVVRAYGAELGRPGLAPHDLRRTYAQIGYDAGVPVTQISALLGHASIATTQRYLNLALDLEVTISDFVPF